MADIYWGSNTSATWGTGAAWKGSSVPGDSDNAIFDGRYQGDVTDTGGSTDLGTGEIRVSSEYQGSMGSSGAPLTANAAALRYQGAGVQAWIGGDFDNAYIATERMSGNAVNLGGDTNTIARLFIRRGRVNIPTNTTISGDIIVSYSRSATSDVLLHIDTGVTVTASILMTGGSLICKSEIGTNLYVNGSSVMLVDDSFVDDQLIVFNGVVDWRSGGTALKEVLMFGGMLDCSQGAEARTITTSTVMPGATIDVDNGADNIVFTNTPRLFKGGQILSYGGANVPVPI